MAYTNTDTNMTTSTGLSAGMQTYYNRELLRTFEPKLIHDQFAEEYPLPPNNGTTMNLRKLLPIDAKVTPLDEGNPGDGTMLSEVAVTMDINQYGDYARLTDKLLMTHMDVNIMRTTKLFGDAGARAVDALCREELNTIPNVIYANGKTSRANLAATDKLTTVELRKAVKMLKKSKAQTFDGWYIAIVGPDTIYDLQEDETFISVAKYQDKEAVYTGEVGRLYGVRLIETTEAKIFEGAGNGGADVASTVVLGRYAYGKTSIKSSKPHVVVKPAGSAGTADPLDQISTVGWKLDAYGVKVLQPEYAVRIESGFTA
jgi:N4-gp56 family major capsid protein